MQNINNRGSGSGKINALLNLIENQPDIDKIYLYAKDPYEAKYQYLINKREGVGINHFKDLNAFIEYSNDMNNVYKNINYFNPDNKNKILIVLDDMIADMIQNKKLNSLVTELFITGRKLNVSLVVISKLYFKVPKYVRLNTIHFFITNILSKREPQQTAVNHSSDISTEDFANIYIENVLLNRIPFLLMILHFHQIILQGSEKIFLGIYDKNHDN